MQKKDCFFIGSIFKLHGYKGKIILFNENSISLNFDKIKYLLIEKDGILIPFFLNKINSYKSDNFLIEFEDINSENQAKELLKCKVYTSKNLIYQSEESSLEKQILGFKIIDKEFGELGNIQTIDNQSSQALIFVKNNNKEFCFPLNNPSPGGKGS
jgi:16S rRNA processing protein RimM